MTFHVRASSDAPHPTRMLPRLNSPSGRSCSTTIHDHEHRAFLPGDLEKPPIQLSTRPSAIAATNGARDIAEPADESPARKALKIRNWPM